VKIIENIFETYPTMTDDSKTVKVIIKKKKKKKFSIINLLGST
jgi:hypothetical protein